MTGGRAGFGHADYIIVGAGSAGCVLAERLGAAGKTVLLLEAGGADSSPFVHMPKGMARLFGDPRMVWHLPTEAHDGIPAETWIRGKMLGGSSSINGMMYFRGHAEDYDEWAKLGATDWGWASMRPAFEAIEGPLGITTNRERTALSDAFILAGEQMGVPRVADLNHDGQEGVGYAPWTVSGGRRSSAARAFLVPAVKRGNVVVETGVMVDRLLFEGRRVVGVAAIRDGEWIEYRTSGEVILSAGALASPAILQRSGIGPGPVLAAAGIPVLHHAPGVGTNLLEHRLLMMEYSLKRALGSNSQYRGVRAGLNALRYLVARTGPLAGGSYEVGAFVRTCPGVSRPDAEILMASYSLGLNVDGSVGIGAGHGIHLFGYPLRSQSAGSIRIRSADPADPPAIRAEYLTHPYDREVTVAMFRFMRRWVAQPALAEFIECEVAPGPGVESDSDIIELQPVKGTLAKERVSVAFMRQLDKADEQTIVTWMDVLYAAASAELKGRQVVTPSSREVNGALQLLLSRMPQKDAELLRRTLMSMKRADDEHACWAARTMYHYLPQLPDDARRDLTRALFTS